MGGRRARCALRVASLLSALVLAVPGARAEPPAAAPDPGPACLYQGRDENAGLCIRKDSFNADLCGTIAHFAAKHEVPPDFFARLIWRESLFRPEAISPKGAEGIAQFMPATARLRRLDNSFDVIQALGASALYLKELSTRFGNFGLAAAAYNAGEAGLARFLSKGRLPLETQDYVFAITGQPAENWKTGATGPAAPPLDPDKPFLEACLTLATSRTLREPVLTGTADWAPWGVQLAGHYNPAIAMRLFNMAVVKLPAPYNAERALITRQRGGSFGTRPRYAARIGRETRQEANALCEIVRAARQPCIVLRNGPVR